MYTLSSKRVHHGQTKIGSYEHLHTTPCHSEKWSLFQWQGVEWDAHILLDRIYTKL